MARLFRKVFAPLLSGLEYADRHYGLGLLIADCIGTRVRMGFLYRKAISGVFDYPRFGMYDTTPAAPSPTLIITPGQVEDGRRKLPCAPCCTRATSSQAHWHPPCSEDSLFGLGEKGTGHPQSFKDTIRSQSSGDVSLDLKLRHFPNALMEAFDLVSNLGSSARHSISSSSGSSYSSSDSSKAVVGTESAGSILDEEPPYAPAEQSSTPPRRPPMLFRLVARSSDEPGSALSSPALSSPALSDISDASATHDTHDTHDTPEPVHPAICNPYNKRPYVHADVVVSPFGRRYQIAGELGAGANGRVKLAISDDGWSYALKVLSKHLLFRRPNQMVSLQMEKLCMEVGRRDNIKYWVEMTECWHDENNVYFMMELGFGTLRERLTDNYDPITRKRWCWQMLKAVKALRDYQIIHSDIKPDNFLIVRGGFVVLSDFGLARWPLPAKPTTDEFLAWTAPFGGTPGYLAPETLREGGCVTHASDIFSLGVSFVELLGRVPSPMWDVGQVPPELEHAQEVWKGMNERLRQRWLMSHHWIEAANLPRGSPERDICEKMLARKLSVDQLLDHRFFNELFDKKGNAKYFDRPAVKMSPLRVGRKYCDLTFEAWYRPEGYESYYDLKPPSFGPVMHGSKVVVSRWLKDNETARRELEQPFPSDFNWMYTPPDDDEDEDENVDASGST